MRMNTSWNTIKNEMFKRYGQNSGNLILHAGAAGWVLSSLAQIAAVYFNDEIPQAQKKFLIPQEMAEAVVNVGSFYLVTKSFKDVGQKLVKTGRWSNGAIRDFVKGKNIKMGDLETNLEGTFKGNESFYNAFSPFKNGVDMITTTIGSVISCNIITPILRNKFGANRQKNSMQEMQAINKPVLPMFNKLSIEDYKKQASLRSPRINTGGSMRI